MGATVYLARGRGRGESRGGGKEEGERVGVEGGRGIVEGKALLMEAREGGMEREI